MIGLFDSHAHYNDARFDEDREALLSSIFKPSEVCPCGIDAIVNIGCCIESSRDCIALAEKYEGIYAAVGLHPQDAALFDENTIPALREMLQHEKVVAIGEIGLDYKYPDPPREQQKEVFRAQMQLARETGKPVCIHDRDAHGDCFDIVREFPDVTGVFHSYSGSAEMARQLVRRGWYISYSGTLTFKNAAGILKTPEAVPLDRLLIETDCPYLAPVPFRGKRNDSRLAYKTAEKLAEIKGVSTDEIVKITRENAYRFFKLLQK